jgi:hypothetical protein
MCFRISRLLGAAALALTAAAYVACDRAETSTSPVTTTSPAGTSTAPSAASAEGRDEALVRVIHAIPAGAPVDIFAGDLAVFDNLAYKAVTPYRAIDGKRYAFALRPAGMPNAKPLASNSEGLDDGEYYSVFALPGDGRTAYLRVVEDFLVKPAEGKARVRVIHGGAEAGEVDIFATGADGPIFDAVDFQAVTGYEDVNPIDGQIEVRAEGQATPLVTIPAVHIEAGRFYTLVIVGRVRSTPKLEAFLIEDVLDRPSAR